jgi:23S rRNA (uracil1939-C5)-methyltransferase
LNERLCVHFGVCGGCQFQDMERDSYAALKLRGVRDALDNHGLQSVEIGQMVHVAPGTRRRAVLKAGRAGDGVQIGFYAAKTHDIVDMHECRLMTPALTALLDPLRDLLSGELGEEAISVHVTESDTGIDLMLAGRLSPSPGLRSKAAAFAAQNGIARILLNKEVLTETSSPSVRLGSASLRLPPRVFLQPTREGEEILWERVRDILKPARKLADLFSGGGTFALRLAAHSSVHAVDSDPAMIEALAASARATPGLKPVTAAIRDLFRRPLQPSELNGFDALLLDPPRAGADAQVKQIAASTLARLAYVSCNADSFARDAAKLVEAGYQTSKIFVLDQFLWSDHIELVAGFTKAAKRKSR